MNLATISKIFLPECQRHGSEDKRKHFKNLLLRSIVGHRPPELFKVFLDILSEITDGEFSLFADFYKVYVQEKSLPDDIDKGRRYKKEDVKAMGLEYRDFLVMVQSMIRKGLLHDVSMGRYDTEPYEFVRTTELGGRLFEYVADK